MWCFLHRDQQKEEALSISSKQDSAKKPIKQHKRIYFIPHIQSRLFTTALETAMSQHHQDKRLTLNLTSAFKVTYLKLYKYKLQIPINLSHCPKCGTIFKISACCVRVESFLALWIDINIKEKPLSQLCHELLLISWLCLELVCRIKG